MTDLTIPSEGAIVTRTEKIWLGDDGIVRAVCHPGLVTHLEDAQGNVRAFAQAAGGRRRLGVVDLRAHAAGVTREAREYYAGPENAKVVLAMALLVRSSVGRLLGNFFLGINRTSFPLKLFGEPEPALEWLKGLGLSD
jgi:hypothetical protein